MLVPMYSVLIYDPSYYSVNIVFNVILCLYNVYL